MRAVGLTTLVLAVAFTTIHCYPAEREETTTKNDKEDRPQIVIVPLEANPNIHRREGDDGSTNYGDQPIVDTGMFSFNPFYGNPFTGFLSGIEAMMARMRQQMSEVLSRLPDSKESTDSSSEEGTGISLWPRFNIPEGKGNTTSVTKVIDGHKVVINETTYASKNDDGNSGSFFKVRIVDIKPDEDATHPTEKDSETLSITTSAPQRDVESLEESIENEIPKGNQNEEFNDIEHFEEMSKPKRENQEIKDVRPQMENLEDFDAIEQLDNSVEGVPQVLPGHDLSGDIRVNQLMADAGVEPNPDAEMFDPMEFQRRVEMFKK